MTHDDLYAQKQPQLTDFVFDQQVAEVFSDMISRSVPGYAATIAQISTVCARFAQAGSNCYDLGCSLGAATVAMAEHLPADDITIIAVDNSQAMLDSCRKNIAAVCVNSEDRVQVVCADIRDCELRSASVVVLNFTLQFIPLAERDALIARIYQAMLPGGVLVISEKISFDDAHVQELMTDMHHAFKKAQGYSDLEISQKRQSIERVLLPETVARHQQRFQDAGFASCDVWFQCFNFVSMVALKS